MIKTQQPPELSTPDWETYRGNNDKPFPLLKVMCGGSVSFARHIGKPLSKELWVDLVHRLCIRGLCVYRHNEDQWTIGWGDGHCIVDLNDDETVHDIRFVPYKPGFAK